MRRDGEHLLLFQVLSGGGISDSTSQWLQVMKMTMMAHQMKQGMGGGDYPEHALAMLREAGTGGATSTGAEGRGPPGFRPGGEEPQVCYMGVGGAACVGWVGNL